MDVDGDKDRPSTGLQMPLLVSPWREDGADGVAGTVDVVFHPWVLMRCAADRFFFSEAAELALGWVDRECKMPLRRRGAGRQTSPVEWKTIKSVYKGGSGPTGSDPVPFPIDHAGVQGAPLNLR